MKKNWERISLSGLVQLLLVLTAFTYAQAPDTLWTRAYGGTNDDWGQSVRQTYDGGYIIAGRTYSFGAGDGDVYFIKTNKNGDTLWTKTYGGLKCDNGWSVQQTSDSGYIITGVTKSFGAGVFDVYLIKTDSSGDTLWTKTYGDVLWDIGFSVQQTSDEGYIIAGWTESFVPDKQNVYLVKTDALGDTIWTRTYGDSIDDYVGRSVQQTIDGGYIIAGYIDISTSSDKDIYLLKTDSLGDTLWTKTYGDTMPDEGYAVRQTSDGGYIIAGASMSYGAHGYDFILIKTDSLGGVVWRKIYGGVLWDIGCSVQQTSDGGYIVAGYSDSFGGLFNYDLYLVRTDSLGDTLWTRVYGGAAAEYIYSVQQTSDKGYIIAGSTASFGSGLYDVYLVKMGPDTLGVEERQGFISENPTAFLEVFPNPCREKVNIRYCTGQSVYGIKLKIYDVTGRIIKQFSLPTSLFALPIVFSWDIKNNLGEKVSSGVYFLRFKAGEFNATRKLFIIK